MLTISVPLKSENTNTIYLLENGAPLENYAAITRVQVILPAITLDSDVNPEYFDLTQPNRLVFKFGNAPLPIGITTAKFRLFTVVYMPDGLFWDFFQMNVFDGGAI